MLQLIQQHLQQLLFLDSGPNILGPVVPVLKVLCMCVVGVLLAQPRVGLLTPDCCKVLSKLVFALFFPCLIFTELGKAISPVNARDWWFIPVNVLLGSAVGCLLGVAVALVCKPPKQFFRLTVVITGIGNTGNLPLSIIGSVCHGWNPFGPDCKRKGVAYISFAQWLSVLIVYVFVYHMLEPPRDYYRFEDDEPEIVASGEYAPLPDARLVEAAQPQDEEAAAAEMPALVEAEWPGVRDARTEDTLTPFLARMINGESFSGSAAQERPRVGCIDEPRLVRNMRIVVERTPIRHMLQPPTVASLLAIAVGSVSALNSVVFDEGAPLEFVTDALTMLGNAMVPCVLLVLGGMCSGGPAKSELGLRTTIGICVARLLLLPLLGIGIVSGARGLGFVKPGDAMFNFVLLLQHTLPSSILVAGMTSLRGFGEAEASSVLFWQHVLFVVPICSFIALYFKYLI